MTTSNAPAFKVGDKVTLRSYPYLSGTVTEVQSGILLQGAYISAEKYKIAWDDKSEGESGFLSAYNLRANKE